jgi:hypothetical protein
VKKTLIVTAAAMLIASTGLSFAGGSSHGASGFAPGTQLNNSTSPTTHGASEFAPGHVKDTTTTGSSKGASEVSPGDRFNDSRTKK